jgi:hypothetical protein
MTDYSNPSTRAEELQRFNISGSHDKANRRFTVSSSRHKETTSKEKDKKISRTTADSSPLLSGVSENNESSSLGKKQNYMTVSASSPILALSSNAGLNFGERREKKVCLIAFESNKNFYFESDSYIILLGNLDNLHTFRVYGVVLVVIVLLVKISHWLQRCLKLNVHID